MLNNYVTISSILLLFYINTYKLKCYLTGFSIITSLKSDWNFF